MLSTSMSSLRRNPLVFPLLFFFVTVSIVTLRYRPRDALIATSDAANSNSLSPNSVEDSHLSSDWGLPSSFIPWLRSRGITPDRVPFVTLGDRKYSRAHHNLHERLEKWGYGRDFVVLCLDAECARDLPFGFGGFIGQSVAALKFAANLDLARNGYSFVFLDGDVYLTGSIDPFDAMLPLSDNSWDIQFQPDDHEPYLRLNIGWYFARSTVATIRYFDRSRQIWEEGGRKTWDQQVMDELGQKMESEEKSLRIYRLFGKRFPNWMLLDWEATLFGNDASVEKFINEAVMVHFTCVQQNLKTYFGLNFGGYVDLEGYYSKPPPLLAVANISGQSDSIHAQIAFAAQIANKTGRTLIWPDSVDMIQRIYYEPTATTGERIDYLHYPTFPGIRAASFGQAQEAGLQLVEGRYLHNQARYNQGHQLKQILIDVESKVLGEHGSISSLEKYIGKIKSIQVAVLDFSKFSPTFLRPADRNLHQLTQLPDIGMHMDEVQERWYRDNFVQSGAKAYIGDAMFDKIRKCGRADMYNFCLEYCNGEGMPTHFG